jgi:hypothetical protein
MSGFRWFCCFPFPTSLQWIKDFTLRVCFLDFKTTNGFLMSILYIFCILQTWILMEVNHYCGDKGNHVRENKD